MPWPVRCGRPGTLYPGSEAGIGDHLPRGGVHRFAGRAGPGGGQRGILRLALDVPDLPLARGRLAEDGRAGDVRLVALDRAAVVDQHHVALAQLLRLDAAVRKRGVLAEDRHRVALRAERAVRGRDVGAQVALRHPFAQGREAPPCKRRW